MLTRFSSVLSLVLLCPLLSAAQDVPKLTAAPIGRILMDGALYASPQKPLFPDGVAIPEARLGVKMSYGNWSSTLDVSYSYAKIGLRNMWIQYDFDSHNSLRFGNFIHQFGLQSQSHSVKITFEQPTAATPFTPGLQLGAMFVHYSPHVYAAASVHVESSALQQIVNAPLFNQQGYGVLSRLIWRNPQRGPLFWHAGISGGFATPQRRMENNVDIHDGFTVSANFPTKVVQLQEIGATVDRAMNLFKFTPELVAGYGRLAFEGQYFFQQINRRGNLRAYISQSGYATLRGLLIGKGYSYVSSTAQIATPAPKSLECVLNYNYCNLSDVKANILGGRANTLSVTFNYYFNPYITARLNFFHAHSWQRADAGPLTLNGFQARLMVMF